MSKQSRKAGAIARAHLPEALQSIIRGESVDGGRVPASFARRLYDTICWRDEEVVKLVDIISRAIPSVEHAAAFQQWIVDAERARHNRPEEVDRLASRKKEFDDLLAEMMDVVTHPERG